MVDISKIPEDIKDSLLIKKIAKNKIISYGKNDMIGFLFSGEVCAARYQDKKKLVFPYILKDGDFLGLIPLLSNNQFDFELETKKDSVILEIPVDIFKEYLLSNPATEAALLKDTNLILLHSTRSFFIRIHGGPRAYLAYLLYLYAEKKDLITSEVYSEVEEMIFTSKRMMHRLIKEFQKEYILEKAPDFLIIKDRERLKAYFKEYSDL